MIVKFAAPEEVIRSTICSGVGNGNYAEGI